MSMRAFLAALLTLMIAAAIGAQTPQPKELPPIPAVPSPPTTTDTNPLTPRQQALLIQLLEEFFGNAQPQPLPQAFVPPVPGGPIAPPMAVPPSGGPITPPPFSSPPGAFQPNPPPMPGMPMPMQMPPRFTFKIDAKAPLSELLPAAPKTPAQVPAWTNEDLGKVPELAFGDPIAKDLGKMKALEMTAHILAKVNHLNRKKADGFMIALLEQRGDLRGLPVLMGEECRTREDQAKAFREMADIVNQQLVQCKTNPNGFGPAPPPSVAVPVGGQFRADQLWATMSILNGAIQRGTIKNSGFAISSYNKDYLNRAMVAALMQILMPEAEPYRTGLAKFLGTVPHPDATKALARLAIFSPEDEVRSAAIESIKPRREKDYTEILMSGFTYPLPAVSKRAAEALVKLERKDVLESLVQVLEAPDPRLPAKVKDATVVRELVKVNHHRNCVLCHAPGNTENIPDGILTVAVPLPGEPLPKPSQGGYQSTPPPSPDIVVRLDMTYLRQDFSKMMPVANPEPWPEMQRFDFLVRTRTLTAAEAQAYEACCEEDEPGRLSPYHRAALFALRELTGRDTEPTAAAWRKLLKLPKAAS
jgi:hypothetical protein